MIDATGTAIPETFKEAVVLSLHQAADHGHDDVDAIAERLMRLLKLYRARQEMADEHVDSLGIDAVEMVRQTDRILLHALCELGAVSVGIGTIPAP